MPARSIALEAKRWLHERISPNGSVSVAVEIDLRCDAVDGDAWPSNLPWNLTAFAGEMLADQCSWSFEVRPPGVSLRTAPVLSPEPPLLFLFDDWVDGAGGHAGRLEQYLDHTYAFGAEAKVCGPVAPGWRRRSPVPPVPCSAAR